MKFLVLALCVCVATAAPPPFKSWQQTKAVAQAVVQAPAQPVIQAAKTISHSGSEADAVILRSESEVNPEGFIYSYETANGISGQATGTLKKVENVDAVSVSGQYQYNFPDGTPFALSYVADENGYQPKSDFLPVAPPVPEAILRSLAYIAAHPQPSDTVVIGKKF